MDTTKSTVSRRSFLAGGATLAGAAAAFLARPKHAEAAGKRCYVGAAHVDVDLSAYLPLHDKNSQAGAVLYTHEEKDYTAQREGHEMRFGLVLIDFDNKSYAIVDCDHVNPPAGFIDSVKAKVSELCDVDLDNIWFHNPHNICAPHSQTYEMTEPAVIEACKLALRRMQPAKFGYGEGLTFINTNRCYQTAKGWQQISNNAGKSDHALPVLRFDDMDGNPIVILYTAHTASGVLENCMNVDANGKMDGEIDSRTITTDVAGLSARYIEEYYGNDCVALFFSGATGDQWCENRGEINYLTVSPKDKIGYVERTYFSPEAQWELLDIVSSRLGYAVIDTANKIKCGKVESFGMLHEKNTYRKLDTDKRGKTAPFTYEQAVDENGKPATIDININVMNINDVAITGFKSELNIGTLDTIRSKSPFKYNVMNSWTAFESADPDGYLPDQEGFDQSGKQASKTKFMPGTAEEMVADACLLLNKLAGIPLPKPGLAFAAKSITKQIGAAGFTVKLAKKTSAKVTYKSSNPKVAKVNATTGKVTVVGVGTATITATVGATKLFGAGSASYKVTVTKTTQAISITASSKSVKASTAAKKKTSFKLGAKAKGARTYKKVSGSSKIKVDKYGKVTLKKGKYTKGKKITAKIKISARATGTHNAATRTVKVTFKIK